MWLDLILRCRIFKTKIRFYVKRYAFSKKKTRKVALLSFTRTKKYRPHRTSRTFSDTINKKKMMKNGHDTKKITYRHPYILILWLIDIPTIINYRLWTILTQTAVQRNHIQIVAVLVKTVSNSFMS